MVVVAIIGILSAVAIPNFKQYQAKSKTSEAKLQLASIYSAQTTNMGDYDTYTTCLIDIGYLAATRGYYRVGFAADVAATRTVTNNNAGNVFCNATSFQLTPNTAGQAATTASVDGLMTVQGGTSTYANLAAIPAPNAPAVAADGSTFIAGAVAFLQRLTPQRIDSWTINENKSIGQRVRGY